MLSNLEKQGTINHLSGSIQMVIGFAFPIVSTIFTQLCGDLLELLSTLFGLLRGSAKTGSQQYSWRVRLTKTAWWYHDKSPTSFIWVLSYHMYSEKGEGDTALAPSFFISKRQKNPPKNPAAAETKTFTIWKYRKQN